MVLVVEYDANEIVRQFSYVIQLNHCLTSGTGMYWHRTLQIP